MRIFLEDNAIIVVFFPILYLIGPMMDVKEVLATGQGPVESDWADRGLTELKENGHTHKKNRT